jgi:hypothetical protein
MPKLSRVEETNEKPRFLRVFRVSLILPGQRKFENVQQPAEMVMVKKRWLFAGKQSGNVFS